MTVPFSIVVLLVLSKDSGELDTTLTEQDDVSSTFLVIFAYPFHSFAELEVGVSLYVVVLIVFVSV